MSRRVRLGLVVAFMVLLWAVSEASGLRAQISVATLHEQFLRHKLLGLLSFAALFALGNLIQIPGWLFSAAAALALVRTDRHAKVRGLRCAALPPRGCSVHAEGADPAGAPLTSPCEA